MRIAIAGPDGSGKSTLCRVLSEKLHQSQVVYAGKREFDFRVTAVALKIWQRSKKCSSLIAFLTQHFLYYPLEYIDNISRFKRGIEEQYYIYDRHPIDRVMMKYALRIQFLEKKINVISFTIQYPLFWFWAKLYTYFFPIIDAVFVLLPTKEDCFKRSGGQYVSLDDAELRIEAYRLALIDLSADSQYHEVELSPNTDIEDVCEVVMSSLGLLSKGSAR